MRRERRVGRRRNRLGVPFGLLLALLGGALQPARAAAAELRWRAPADCARAQAVTEQVEKLVGQRLATVEGIDFEVAIEQRSAGSFVLVLRSLSAGAAPREREIAGQSCIEVSDAASLAIALAISERTSGSDAPHPAEEEAAQDLAATEEDGYDAVPPPADAPPEAPRPRPTVEVGLVFESGALPELGFGIGLGGGLELGLLKARASLAFFIAQEKRLPGEMRGGSFALYPAALDACLQPVLGIVHGVACAGFELGLLTAEGEGVLHMRSGTAIWAAPRAELGIGLALHPIVRLWLRGGAALALSRPAFMLQETDAVHRPANLSTRGVLALEFVL